MNWKALLSGKRLGIEEEGGATEGRSRFLVDVDRLIYSAHFRKLQDKTQVHPLSKSDFVRTRLTHSLEVASVSRSLGYNIGKHILKTNTDLDNITEHDFGYIVQAAALAHDIGNPPFGHLGEYAIIDYYKNLFKNISTEYLSQLTTEQQDNLCNFDGNSQGFRVITNIAGWKKQGGLRLTYATLGTFLKYPRAYAPQEDIYSAYNLLPDAIKNQVNLRKYLVGHKKTGVFQSESSYLSTIAQDLGLINISKHHLLYARHPLAFLTESADDICYSIADLEDGFFVGLLDLAEVESLLIPIVRRASKYSGNNRDRIEALQAEDFYKDLDDRKKVEFLRGKAVSNLIQAVSEAFIKHEEIIMNGNLNNELLDLTEFGNEIAECKKTAREKIFKSHHKINAEISGIGVINQVMQALTELILHPNTTFSRLLLGYLDKNFILENSHNLLGENSKLSLYEKFLTINDIVSDFTDRNIINFNKILKGL